MSPDLSAVFGRCLWIDCFFNASHKSGIILTLLSISMDLMHVDSFSRIVHTDFMFFFCSSSVIPFIFFLLYFYPVYILVLHINEQLHCNVIYFHKPKNPQATNNFTQKRNSIYFRFLPNTIKFIPFIVFHFGNCYTHAAFNGRERIKKRELILFVLQVNKNATLSHFSCSHFASFVCILNWTEYQYS